MNQTSERSVTAGVTRTLLRRSLLLATAVLVTVTGTLTMTTPAVAAPDERPAARTTPPPGWRNAYLPQHWAEVVVVDELARRGEEIPLLGELTLAAAELGSWPDEVAAAVEVLEPVAESRWYAVDGVPMTHPLAQALLLAAEAGTDPRDFGGVDLVALLEQDSSRPTNATQALVARALAAAESPRAGDRRADLSSAQCPGGWWTILPDACDTMPPDVWATASAALALHAAPEGSSVAAATAGLDWLESVQAADGSFFHGFARVTALAGRALGEAGRAAPAGAVAVWLRRLQGASISSLCGTRVPIGYVAPTRLDYGQALRNGLSAKDTRSWLLVTAVAAHALHFPPPGDGGWPRLTAPTGYQRGGSTARFVATGVPAGMEVCLAVGTRGVLARADAEGRVVVRAPLPTSGGSARARLLAYDAVVGHEERVRLLQARRLRVGLRASQVRAGGRQVVLVRELAPRERVAVRYRGRIVARGTATERGVFRAGFAVGRGTGREAVAAVGRFANRRGSAVFTLTPGSCR